MDTGKVLVVYIQPIEKEEKDTLELVISALKEKNIKFGLVKRDDLKEGVFKDYELVIIIGGDGTFLKAAHYIKEQLVLGVNCSCSLREGFFLRTDLRNFRERFELFLKGEYTVVNLIRIGALIDGAEAVETVPALNEVYAGERRAYKVSKYYLKVKNREEMQKSSGVLIATAAGSHAWLKSAGGNVLDIESDDVQYIVREPYRGRLLKPTILIGTLQAKASPAIPAEFEITSLMEEGVVVIDSAVEYDFKKGKKLKIKRAEPLRLVSF